MTKVISFILNTFLVIITVIIIIGAYYMYQIKIQKKIMQIYLDIVYLKLLQEVCRLQ